MIKIQKIASLLNGISVTGKNKINQNLKLNNTIRSSASKQLDKNATAKLPAHLFQNQNIDFQEPHRDVYVPSLKNDTKDLSVKIQETTTELLMDHEMDCVIEKSIKKIVRDIS